MDMANLPVLAPESAVPTADERFWDAIADQLAAGKRPDRIAREVYPKDLRKRKQLRARIWRLIYHEPELANRVALRAKAEFLIHLVPTARSLGRRAAKTGRPDAAKLLFEASGFHNPRVKHDHSGDINIRLTIPRPEREPVDVTDAEVVD